MKVLLDKRTYQLREALPDDMPITIESDRVILPRRKIYDLGADTAILCTCEEDIVPVNWRHTPHYYDAANDRFITINDMRP